jgi:peptidoglycan/xylan/chitin deacetylase (PgdA/CDA1 family)
MMTKLESVGLIDIDRSARALILMYHRVHEPQYDPWNLCVSPANFDQQMHILKESFHVIYLTELVESLRAKSLPANAVVITFDDCYADNVTHALPILEKWKTPATFFVSTALIDTNGSFWWDDLADLIMSKALTPEEATSIVDQYAQKLRQTAHSTYETGNDPLLEAYYALWHRINPMRMEQRELVMQALNSARHGTAAPVSMINDRQLRHLSHHPLAEIGAHTVHHLSLPVQNDAIIAKEIVSSCDCIQSLTGRRPTLFSYPFGQYDERVVQQVNDAGLVAAVTTFESPVVQDSHALQLPRFQVNDWDGNTFKHHLSQWMA